MGKRKGLEALGEARLATIVAFGDVRSEHTLKGAIPQNDALAALRQYGRIESYVHPASDSVMQRFGLIQDGAPQPVLLAVFFSIKAGSTFHSLAIDATLWPSHSSQASHQRSPSGCPAHHARLVSLPNLNHLQYSVTAALPTPTHPLSAYPPIFPNRSCTDKVPGTNSERPLWIRQLGGQGLHLRRWRVIVRNINFRANERAIEKIFRRAAGVPWEVKLPRNENGKPRGFAFVGFICREHAQKAIDNVNNTKLFARTVAVDWALGKQEFQRVAAEDDDNEHEDADAVEETAYDLEGDAEESQADVTEGNEDEDMRSESEDEVGAALNHEPRSSEGKGDEEADEEVEQDDIDNSDLLATDGEKRAMSSALRSVLKDENYKFEGAKDETHNDNEDDDDYDERERAQGEYKQHEDFQREGSAGEGRGETKEGQGYTVFVKGLPVGVQKGQLYKGLGSFGKIIECRLVIDQRTMKFKGSAFVEFEQETSARRAVEASKQDPGVEVAGLYVQVRIARSKGAMDEDDASKGSERDRRNLYLAREGKLQPNSAAVEGVSETDMAKRQRFLREKQTKLRNPNFFVSRTRLSIKNLPKSYDEKRLKQLVLWGVKQRAPKSVPRVTQSKILRSEEELDANGRPKPRGFGFVEFSKHQHALTALRHLNNNPQVFTPSRRPIVEFAVENVRATQRLQRMKELRRLRQYPAPVTRTLLVMRRQRKNVRRKKQVSEGVSVGEKADANKSNQTKDNWASEVNGIAAVTVKQQQPQKYNQQQTQHRKTERKAIKEKTDAHKKRKRMMQQKVQSQKAQRRKRTKQVPS